MYEEQMDKAHAIKYLAFLAKTARDLLSKTTPIVADDLQQLRNEHELFVRRVEESRWVSEAFKETVRELVTDSIIFGDSPIGVSGGLLNTLGDGRHRHDRTAFGVLGSRILMGLKDYGDRLESVRMRIDTFRFWR